MLIKYFLVRPKFGTQFAIKSGRHPLLDEENIEVVPNETVCLAFLGSIIYDF